MATEKIKIDLDVVEANKEIDKLQEKVNQLVETLEKATKLINSLNQ